MGKVKPQERSTRAQKNGKRAKVNGAAKKSKLSPEELLAQATMLLQTSQLEEAFATAQQALAALQSAPEPTIASLPALTLLGEINIERGDVDAARKCFTGAAALDLNGTIAEAEGGGAEKFMWLAQLSEEGGADSVKWFQKGADVLRREIAELEGKRPDAEAMDALKQKKGRLANALCGIAEVYMTDLSWEDDAETRCDTLVTEALLVAPESSEALQTLASVRISQAKLDDAQAALSRSLELWIDLDPENPAVPDFPARISLARLLMEAEMEDDAFEVLDRLVTEDDSSVEAWYLGGWCLHLLGERRQDAAGESSDKDGSAHEVSVLLRGSRDWLTNSLKLYGMLDYEDERLKSHAEELVEKLNAVLGPPAAEDADDEDGGEWVDDDENDQDDVMQGT